MATFRRSPAFIRLFTLGGLFPWARSREKARQRSATTRQSVLVRATHPRHQD